MPKGWHLLTRWQQNVGTEDSTDAPVPLGAFPFNYLPSARATVTVAGCLHPL